MKFNKWTLGLAAVGVVSLASAAMAEEQVNMVQTMVSGTTISGYVDTSMQWNFGSGNAYLPPYKFGGTTKADGFNLNVVQLSISKPLDESEWASGYKVDLWFGPDANALGTQSGWSSDNGETHDVGPQDGSDFAIRQAYVALRTPLGNGIEWKIGVFDTIIGYESVESGNNPNYTRSYGHTIEPQTHTGVLATYRVSDCIALAAGVANTDGPTINQRAFRSYESDHEDAESYKTYMGSIALTAPKDWGWMAGSTLYGGVVNGFNDNEANSDYDMNTTSWYVGGTLATPITGLKLGAAFDYLDVHNWQSYYGGNGEVWSVAAYGSYQATEKLSLHLRGEYVEDKAYYFSPYDDLQIWAVTATAQYDLWKNVISRVELRWDQANDKAFGGDYSYEDSPSLKNAFMLAANIIYKF